MGKHTHTCRLCSVLSLNAGSLAANADQVKTALRGGAPRVANTPGDTTVTKTLAKRISVSFASLGLFSLTTPASVVPLVEMTAVREEHSSGP